jgi:hypothetical protein
MGTYFGTDVACALADSAHMVPADAAVEGPGIVTQVLWSLALLALAASVLGLVGLIVAALRKSRRRRWGGLAGGGVVAFLVLVSAGGIADVPRQKREEQRHYTTATALLLAGQPRDAIPHLVKAGSFQDAPRKLKDVRAAVKAEVSGTLDEARRKVELAPGTAKQRVLEAMAGVDAALLGDDYREVRGLADTILARADAKLKLLPPADAAVASAPVDASPSATASATTDGSSDSATVELGIRGIGLSRAAWERTHARDPEYNLAYGPRIRRGEAKYVGVIDSLREDGSKADWRGLVFTQPSIMVYTMNMVPAPLAEAMVYARAELPSDAKEFWSRTSVKCKSAQYSSAALARDFGPNVIIEIGFYSYPRDGNLIFDHLHVDSILFSLRAKGPAYEC